MSHHSAIAVAIACATYLAPAAEPDSEDIFSAWKATPATYATIPDVSWAGYHHGDDPLPTPAAVVSVLATGAIPDDGKDDSAAFHRAIAEAAAKGGGAVEVPAGTWELDDILRLSADRVVLRGAGTDVTKLLFRKPLIDLQNLPLLRGQTQWSWSGGLVWMGPANTWNLDGTLNPEQTLACEAWERWRLGEHLGTITTPASAGSNRIELSTGTLPKADDWVMLLYHNPSDLSLVKTMAGHELVANGDLGGIARVTEWPWPVQIQAIDGRSVILAQPLRLDIRPEWQVEIHSINGIVREAGIEHLTIATTGFKANRRHNTYPGWNGIYLNRVADCFVRDVSIQDVDNGIIHAAAKSTTVTGFRISGGGHHHATALRVKSHDNLLEDFTIASHPMHGINTEGMSSGNVWRKGILEHGTFDSHRGMSFDLVRTDITVAGDGRPGGAGDAGPFLGRRCVHWNIRISGGDGSYINQPEQHSLGALVGVQGPAKNGVSFAMPAGDKGTIIADSNQVPKITDLYLAQLASRHAQPNSRLPSPARPIPAKVTKPVRLSSQAQTYWNTILSDRIRARLTLPNPLRVTLAGLDGEVDLGAISAQGLLSIRSVRGDFDLPISGLSASDRANIALQLIGENDALGSACAAVHLGAMGDERSSALLSQCGTYAERVRTDLGLATAQPVAP